MNDIPLLQKGLFDTDANGVVHLLANRCERCVRVYFPRRAYCAQCSGSKLTDIRLSRQGRVCGFSLIGRKPAAAVIDPPYIQADVEMPEGVHVFTVLDQCAYAEVTIGMPVEVYVGEVNSPEGDGKALAYRFKPVAAAAQLELGHEA